MNNLKIIVIRIFLRLLGLGFIALGFYFWKTQYFGLILAFIGIIIIKISKRYGIESIM